MKKNNKSIYNSPKKYAKRCDIPLNLAKIQCKKYKKEARQRKKIKCPACHRKSLVFCGGSYEEGYGDYIECAACGEAYAPEEIKNGYMLHFGWDFDVVLYYSGKTPEEKISGRLEACGSEKIEDWVKFAEDEIRGKYD